jgi:hypothetical protein
MSFNPLDLKSIQSNIFKAYFDKENSENTLSVKDIYTWQQVGNDMIIVYNELIV